VRELAEDVTAMRAAALPSHVARDVVHDGEELFAGDVRRSLEVLLAACERRRHAVAKTQLQRITTDYVGAAQIRLPVAEHGAAVGEDDVVLADQAVGRILAVRQQRVRA